MLPWSNRKPPRNQRKRAPKPDWLSLPGPDGLVTVKARANTGPQPKPEPRRRPDTQTTGMNAEQRAALWLSEQGLPVVGMNVRCRQGEIDLIVASGQTAVIVEVRCRNSGTCGSASESIDWHKRKRIVYAALWWWTHTGSRHFHSLRFDTVTFDASRQAEWTRHAFDAQGSI